MAALPIHVYVIVQDPNVPLATAAFRHHLVALTGPCMYSDATRLRQSCAVVHGSTLVVWGALEAAVVFALLVRFSEFLSVLYRIEGKKEEHLFYVFFLVYLLC